MHWTGMAFASFERSQTLFSIGVDAAIVAVTGCFCCFFVFHIISIKDLKGFAGMQNARMHSCDICIVIASEKQAGGP